jgi:hypothetical protein
MSATENQILSGTTFESSDFGYAKPKVNKSGGKSVPINNATTNRALYLSTPLMLTWGINEFVDDKTGRKTYDMSLQFPKDEYKTESADQFLASMVAFQDKLKADAVKYSKAWMNKSKLSAEVVDALFHPMLRYPKDPTSGEPDMTRPPTLRIKLDYWDEAFTCEIYDMQQKLLFPGEEGAHPSQLIPKATNVATVIRCGGLWFANGKFGVTWRLVQAVVKPRANLKGKCWIQLSDADKSKLDEQQEAGEDDNSVGVAVADDSDEESEEEEEDEEPSFTAPVKKVIKKKVVRRKKTAEAVP